MNLIDRLHGLAALGGAAVIANAAMVKLTSLEMMEAALIEMVAAFVIVGVKQVFWRG